MTDVSLPGKDTVQAAILDFINRELVPPQVTVGEEDNLLTGELLDSLAVLRLATFVDESFEIGMQPKDFVIDNFQSAAVLTGFVLQALERRR